MPIKSFFNLIPKKHGAWSIFFISIITGILCSKNFKLNPFILLFLSSLSGFFLRENMSLFLKLRKGDERKKLILKISLICLLILFLTFIPLLIFYKFYLLIPISILAGFITILSFYFSFKRKELTISAEILGILGLSLLLPAFYYISKGYIDKDGLFLFIFAFLFFTGSVFNVRYLVRNKNILSENLLKRLNAGKYSLLYTTLFFLIAIYLSSKNYLSELSYIAVLPALFKSYFFVFRKFDKPLPLKKIGFTELFASIIFAFLLIITYI